MIAGLSPVPLPPAWAELLLEADTAPALVEAAARIATSLDGVEDARLLWEIGAIGPWRDPAPPPPGPVLSLADDALLAAEPTASPDQRWLAVPLPASTAVLVLATASGFDRVAALAALERPLRIIDRRLDKRLRLAGLEHEVARLERSEQVQRALFDISELAASDRDMAEVLRGIHAIVGTLMYAENFFIVLRDAGDDTLDLLYFVDTEDDAPFQRMPMDAVRHSATWYVLRDGRPLRGDNARLREQVDGPLTIVGSDSPDWLGVPMLRGGEAVGALVVQSYRDDVRFSDADQALLGFVASHILAVLERKRSTELLERNVALRTQELAEANRGLQQQVAERERAERLQAALFQIAQLATDDSDEAQFYAAIHAIVGQLLNAENFFIALVSEDGTSLEFPYYVDVQLKRRRESRPLARGLSEYVIRHRQPLLCDFDLENRLVQLGEVAASQYQYPASHCWLGVPLFSGADAIGLVAVQSYDPAVVYGPADQELLGFVASQIGNSLHRRRSAQFQRQAYAQLEERVAERTLELRRQVRERERAQEQLRHEVMHDALTGLPNRGQMHDRIEAALARLRAEPTRRCALLYLDVDRFKVINDSLGHLAGDDFLRQVARRLQASVRGPDLVARLSGDEFAILLEDVRLDDDGVPVTATAVAQRVLDLLTEPLHIGDRRLEPSASIGIAIGDGRYREADELVRDADVALYQAKALGRKRWQLFDDSLRRSAIDVLALEVELRDAMRLDQLEPYLQPIVRLADGAVVGHEALLRWNHPQRGVLGPAQFLPVAEDSGLIEAIDWRIFKRSFVHATGLPDDSYLSINVAPRHLHREDFDERLLELLARTGLPPRRLQIEVTEGSLLEDPDHVRAILRRLQAAGIGVALDDFGTGYSSLSYLHAFPLKVLKIDRTFLAALGEQADSAAVIAAVLALARALGLDVVAEGIETAAQHEALLALGCEFGQGYLFGHPAPAARWTGAL